MIAWDVNVTDVAQLEPSFRDDVTTVLAASPFQWKVVYAYRSLELQGELYARFRQGGPRAAPAGKSAHNFGLAVDVQLWVPVHTILDQHDRVILGGAPSAMEWNVKAPGWQWLFDAVKHAPRLHSGIEFGDFDHIERLNWKLYKDWSAQSKRPPVGEA